MSSELLDYYATPGRHTTLGESPLPSTDIREIVAAVQGLLIDDTVAQSFYEVELGAGRAEAIHERHSAPLLGMARALDPRPLDQPRAPADRVGARCHSYSRLTVALLRAAGVPARARCGFGACFRPGWLVDEHGAHWIAGNLRLDLASLNKVEMLPWDVWGASWEPGSQPPDDLLACFDSAAALPVDPDANFTKLRQHYDSDALLRMDGTVFNALRGQFETVE